MIEKQPTWVLSFRCCRHRELGRNGSTQLTAWCGGEPAITSRIKWILCSYTFSVFPVFPSPHPWCRMKGLARLAGIIVLRGVIVIPHLSAMVADHNMRELKPPSTLWIISSEVTTIKTVMMFSFWSFLCMKKYIYKYYYFSSVLVLSSLIYSLSCLCPLQIFLPSHVYIFFSAFYIFLSARLCNSSYLPFHVSTFSYLHLILFDPCAFCTSLLFYFVCIFSFCAPFTVCSPSLDAAYSFLLLNLILPSLFNLGTSSY